MLSKQERLGKMSESASGQDRLVLGSRPGPRPAPAFGAGGQPHGSMLQAGRSTWGAKVSSPRGMPDIPSASRRKRRAARQTQATTAGRTPSSSSVCCSSSVLAGPRPRRRAVSGRPSPAAHASTSVCCSLRGWRGRRQVGTGALMRPAGTVGHAKHSCRSLPGLTGWAWGGRAPGWASRAAGRAWRRSWPA